MSVFYSASKAVTIGRTRLVDVVVLMLMDVRA
jgi:hypothetical protein